MNLATPMTLKKKIKIKQKKKKAILMILRMTNIKIGNEKVTHLIPILRIKKI